MSLVGQISIYNFDWTILSGLGSLVWWSAPPFTSHSQQDKYKHLVYFSCSSVCPLFSVFRYRKPIIFLQSPPRPRKNLGDPKGSVLDPWSAGFKFRIVCAESCVISACDSLSNLKYHPLECASRYREQLLQMDGNNSYLCNLRANISKCWYLSIIFIPILTF